MTEPTDSTELQQILESCYAAICDGSEPDLDSLCAKAPELRPRVERILERERNLLDACVPDEGPVRRRLPTLPANVGEFVILEPIGIGGMSHVYRARQEPLGREVALKVLRDDLVADSRGRLRFAREASITASLEHPHIVPVYAAGEADGRVYLAMKLLHGRSLDQHHSPLEPDQVARIGTEVASALSAAHEVGVVHRDIKPANIVLEHGSAFVVDFGLAAFADRASVLTQPNATPGTLIYLPPEVASRRASNLDPRADVKGVGATLYELLAGHPPFDASNPVRALQQILNDDPKPLQLKGRQRDLETIVMRAMDKSPTHRFQSAQDLVDELTRYRQGLPILTRPPHLVARGWRTVQRHPAFATLMATIAVLAIALLVQTILHSNRSEESLLVQANSIETHIRAGSLASAQGELLDLSKHELTQGALGRQVRSSLQSQWQAEYELQLLVLSLLHPLSRTYGDYLADVRDRAAARHSAAQRDGRAAAAFALARWRQSGLRQVPSDPLQRTWPRTAALLAATPNRAELAAAVAGLGEESGGNDDHLFAAIAMRITEQPETTVEAELRLADRTNRSPLLLQCLALSLEAQGRFREAYEAMLQLLDSPVCGPLAHWSTARLAAAIGERSAAQAHLQTALGQPQPTDPLLLDLAYPSELQVLSQLGGEAFWRRWREAPPRAKRLAQYWRMAGYVRAYEPDEGQLEDAIELFEKGLRPGLDAVQLAGLQAAICQTNWARLSGYLPETPNASLDARLAEELQQLAQDAEQLARRCELQDLPASLRSDALLTAAQCRIERREWTQARSLLDRAASDDQPEPLAVYAVRVAQLAALQLLDESSEHAPPRNAFGQLETAVAIALERAKRVLQMARGKRRVDPMDLGAAQSAAIVCAAYLGDARTMLQESFQWQPAGDAFDETTNRIIALGRSAGGLLLDHVDCSSPHRHQLLLEASAAVAQAFAAKLLDTNAARSIIEVWRNHPSVASNLQLATWQPAKAALSALAAKLDATVAVQPR